MYQSKHGFYTYLHCTPEGIPFYVGKSGGMKKGYRSRNFKGRNQYHQSVVARYGKENIQVFMFPCSSEAQAYTDERQQIAQLRAEGYDLCNIVDGCGADGYWKFRELHPDYQNPNSR